MNFVARFLSSGKLSPTGLNAGRKLSVACGFALLCLGAIGYLACLNVYRLRQHEEWSRATSETISALRLVLSHVTDAESAQRGYALLGDESYLAPYIEARRDLSRDLTLLGNFTAFNVEQRRRQIALAMLVDERMARLANEIEVRRSQGFEMAREAVATGVGKRLHDRVRGLAAEMEEAEEVLLRARQSRAIQTAETATALIVIGIALAFVVVVVALMAARSDLARRLELDALIAAAGRMGRIGAWAVELPGLELTWSEEVRAIYEVPPGFELTVENGIGFYAPESRGRVGEALDACVRHGTPFDLELQLVTAKNRQVWVRAIGEAERDSKGVIRRVRGAVQDISERRQAMVSLQLQQAELRVLFDLMPAMIWFKDTNDVILRVNQRAADTAGKSVEEIEGSSSREIYPQDWEKFKEDDLEVIRSGTPRLGIIEQMREKNGEDLWVQTDKVPVRDKNGTVVGVVVMARDITSTKRADENARNLAAIVENSTDAIISATLKGIVTSWNPAAERMFGYSASEIIGRPIQLLVPPEKFNEENELLAGYTSGEFLRAFETVRVGRDGRRLDVSATISPIRDSGGGIVGVSKIFSDITDRKRAVEALRESEARFRELAENIDEVFWVLEPVHGRRLYVSPAYERIWGRTCQSAYEAPQSWFETVHPEDRERLIRIIQNRKEKGAYDERFRIVRPDGTERWIRDRAFPVRDTEGAIIRWVGIAEDLTEYRHMEEQLRQTQKMEAIGTLAGGIAHDFNNILTSIIGYTELSRMVLKENPEVHGYLGSVLKASSRAADLVRQILTFSRQEPVKRRLIQLLPVVDETLKLLRASIPSTIRFDASLATDSPTVLADATQVHQVLMNLGTNAWHAMRDHGGTLQVRLERCVVDEIQAAAHPSLRPGVYTLLCVADTGCGMDQATQRRIFEPFFTTKASGGGTGLGLSVVLGIMDAHDGAIIVYSQVGEGTTFRLYFPEHAGEEAAIVADGAPVPVGQGERILFVDDEDLLVELGQMTLTALGYEVEATTRPAEALAMVQADPGRFALVLTDMTMPGMTGLFLAEQIRKVRLELPIVLMTGNSLPLEQGRAETAGICSVLLKPASIRSLGVAVHRALSPQPALQS